jgi:hypothetical protein
MPRRFRQILLVTSILWLSWLIMMLVHEFGHVLGGLATGGKVRRVVWHPAVISRTDVWPNPHPLIEVCAGPILGSVIPLAIAIAASRLRQRVAYLIWVVAGFCLIANGAYMAIGAIHPIGDAEELVAHGMQRWPMATFGLLAVAGGFWIWERVSPRLGFGVVPAEISAKHAYMACAVAVMMTAVGLAFGDRGI